LRISFQCADAVIVCCAVLCSLWPPLLVGDKAQSVSVRSIFGSNVQEIFIHWLTSPD
jgi:hypothetical protein